jgi:hypothetical protein
MQKPAPTFPAFSAEQFESLQKNTAQGRPLYLQIAALHACELGTAENIARWSRSELLNSAVERERRYIRNQCHGTTTPAEFVECLSAVLYFAGTVSRNHPDLIKIIKEEAELRGYANAPAEILNTLALLFEENSELIPLNGFTSAWTASGKSQARPAIGRH